MFNCYFHQEMAGHDPERMESEIIAAVVGKSPSNMYLVKNVKGFLDFDHGSTFQLLNVLPFLRQEKKESDAELRSDLKHIGKPNFDFNSDDHWNLFLKVYMSHWYLIGVLLGMSKEFLESLKDIGSSDQLNMHMCFTAWNDHSQHNHIDDINKIYKLFRQLKSVLIRTPNHVSSKKSTSFVTCHVLRLKMNAVNFEMIK